MQEQTDMKVEIVIQKYFVFFCRHELDMARIKMKSLEAELHAKGITPDSAEFSFAEDNIEVDDDSK